jgi:hypothetical protein
MKGKRARPHKTPGNIREGISKFAGLCCARTIPAGSSSLDRMLQ